MNAILALLYLVEVAAASPSLPVRNKILHSNIYNYSYNYYIKNENLEITMVDMCNNTVSLIIIRILFYNSFSLPHTQHTKFVSV